jgi:hypothetical protein
MLRWGHRAQQYVPDLPARSERPQGGGGLRTLLNRIVFTRHPASSSPNAYHRSGAAHNNLGPGPPAPPTITSSATLPGKKKKKKKKKEKRKGKKEKKKKKKKEKNKKKKKKKKKKKRKPHPSLDVDSYEFEADCWRLSFLISLDADPMRNNTHHQRLRRTARR